MSGRRKIAIEAAAIAIAVGTWVSVYSTTPRPIPLQGAVLQQASDAKQQVPIANVEVSEADGLAPGGAKTDASGFFRLNLLPRTKAGQRIRLQFRHPKYQPLDLNETVDGKLYVARMTPIRPSVAISPHTPQTAITNVLVTYSMAVPTSENVGSVVKTFQIENTGNVPCKQQSPCSPNGKWKAATSSVAVDADKGDEFRNARVSCIAGPCPFTRIDKDNFSQGGSQISVTVRDWSDTATFLLEAEVFHRGISDMNQSSYPVIFGRALSFTLPPQANGPTVEAELSGANIVFPLGPNGFLSWADCEIHKNADGSKAFQCTLKPGYQFE